MFSRPLRWLVLVVAVASLSLFDASLVHAEPLSLSEEEITSFASHITVQPDGILAITEDLQVYFSDARHGIDRDIPTSYRDAAHNSFKLRLDVDRVTDVQGKKIRYEIQHPSGMLRLHIGDPNETVTGTQTYRITYHVRRAMLWNDVQDILYWNVSGNEWRLPLREVSATVTLPGSVSRPDVLTECYTGDVGSLASACKKNVVSGDFTFFANEPLTVRMAWPAGVIARPTTLERAWDFFADNIGFLLPFLTLAALFTFWWKRGRDPKMATIIAEYEPPAGFLPADAQALLKEGAGSSSISATIVFFAVQGYLTIRESEEGAIFKKKTYMFLRTEKSADALALRERELLDALFNTGKTVTLASLAKDLTWQKKRTAYQGSILDDLAKKGYFSSNPATIKVLFIVGAFVMFFVTIWTSDVITDWFGRATMIGLIISAILIGIAGQFMPRKSVHGVEMSRKILGFKLYLSTAEKYRLQWQEKEKIFETFLPYAMAFGVVAAWATALKSVIATNPTWWSSTMPMTMFNASDFSSSLDSFSSAASAGLAPSSSSSGSSGGGFGGGGGGSW